MKQKWGKGSVCQKSKEGAVEDEEVAKGSGSEGLSRDGEIGGVGVKMYERGGLKELINILIGYETPFYRRTAPTLTIFSKKQEYTFLVRTL